MKNIYRFLIVIFILCNALTMAQSLLIEEYFNYPVGTLVNTLTNFNVRASSGTYKQTISSKVLTYPGYGASGIGKSDSLTADGDDFSRDFAPYVSGQPIPANAITSGSIYYSALVNVQTATNPADYFLAFHYNNTYNGKVFVQSNGNGFSFATAKNTVGTYESTVRTFNTTYLIVVKYTFNAGTNDDAIDMWVNPSSLTTEPVSVAPFNNLTDATRNDYAAIGGVVIRQATAGQAPKVYVSGIRISTNWLTLLTATPTSVEDSKNVLPTIFFVEQNYPNPFNPETVLNYSLPTYGYVEISVFNVLGEKISNLFSGEKSAGSYQIRWDGKNQYGHNVSSGVYLAKVTFGNSIKTIKMLLAK